MTCFDGVSTPVSTSNRNTNSEPSPRAQNAYVASPKSVIITERGMISPPTSSVHAGCRLDPSSLKVRTLMSVQRPTMQNDSFDTMLRQAISYSSVVEPITVSPARAIFK